MIVEQVIQALSAGGIRAEAAFPQSKIVRITEPVAAVSLERTQPKGYTAVVLVEILSPQEGGGYICQKKALEACSVLETLGGVCDQGSCTFLRNGNIFRVPIRVTFRSAVRAGSTEQMPAPILRAGGITLGYACGFSAVQAVNSTDLTLQESPWEITVEEFFPWGVWDTLEPDEPFTLELRCTGGVERYQNCRWSRRERHQEELGIRQIRRGKAQERVLTNT